jgi:Glutaredoxin
LQRITGADEKALVASLEKYGRKGPVALSTTTKSPAAPPTSVDFGEKPSKKVETPEELTKRLTGLMNMDKAVLFMKGTPDKPECGFSRRFVAKLREQNVPFSYFNIYTDESVRQGMMIS